MTDEIIMSGRKSQMRKITVNNVKYSRMVWGKIIIKK